jgi:hypothetical protein
MKIKIPILTIIQTKMLLTLVKNKSLIIFCQDINLHLKKIYSEIEKNKSAYSVSRSSQKFSTQPTNSCNEN